MSSINRYDIKTKKIEDNNDERIEIIIKTKIIRAF